MTSIIAENEEFARGLEEWLHRIPKGGVLDLPSDQPTSSVTQHSGYGRQRDAGEDATCAPHSSE